MILVYEGEEVKTVDFCALFHSERPCYIDMEKNGISKKERTDAI